MLGCGRADSGGHLCRYGIRPLSRIAYDTGETMLIGGEVTDNYKADGQFLLKFTPRDGGEAVKVFFNLNGMSFRQYFFKHQLAGAYELDVFLGGPAKSN